jgi:hypothetical protein
MFLFFLDGKLCVWDRMFCNLRNYSIMNVVEVCFPVYYHLVLFICLLFLFVSKLLVCFCGVSRRAKNPLVYTAKQLQVEKGDLVSLDCTCYGRKTLSQSRARLPCNRSRDTQCNTRVSMVRPGPSPIRTPHFKPFPVVA